MNLILVQSLHDVNLKQSKLFCISQNKWWSELGQKMMQNGVRFSDRILDFWSGVLYEDEHYHDGRWMYFY